MKSIRQGSECRCDGVTAAAAAVYVACSSLVGHYYSEAHVRCLCARGATVQ